jgi:hypothetical protein
MTATATATAAKKIYRTFTAFADTANGVFVINETGTCDTHPMYGLCTDGVTDTAAWNMARSTALPLVVTMLDGRTANFGVVFEAKEFERAAYSGYVSYGLSMSDGYYAPITFDAWVKSFRQDQGREILRSNDTPQYVKDALPLYQASL